MTVTLAVGATRWEHFPHDTDVGVRGFGTSAEQAIAQAGEALTAIMTDAEVKPRIAVEVHCEAPDFELLLFDFLNTVIYEMALRNMLFGRFDVRINGSTLDATIWGEPVDVVRHAVFCEPKGATYNALKVARRGGDWSAACIVAVRRPGSDNHLPRLQDVIGR